MPKISFTKDGDMGLALKKFFKSAEDAAVRYEDQILIALNERILALTPVWEGDAIVNWRWSTQGPVYEHVEARGSVAPGHTNDMTLGEEPRRAINETRPRQSLMGALRAKEPVDIYLTNASPHIVDLEYGLLPTPSKSRVKAGFGILRLAIKEVLGTLR